MGPLLGTFEFDLAGRTGALYSLAMLLVTFIVARRLVNSPFGATLMAIRDNRLRAMAIGIPVTQRLVTVYTLGAAVAGASARLDNGTAAGLPRSRVMITGSWSSVTRSSVAARFLRRSL